MASVIEEEPDNTCPVCKEHVPLTPRGHLKAHWPPPPPNGYGTAVRRRCPGGGTKAPKIHYLITST